MKEAVSDVLAVRAQDAGINRLFGYSLAVHLLIGVAAVLMPADWLSNQAARPNVMEVSLGGSLGERTTGVAPISGRRVEQAVPEPKRPEPLKVAPPPKPDTMPTPATKVVTPPKTPAKPLEKPPATAASAPAKPPVTGKQVQTGTAVADTGASGQGPGITQGGGGGTGGAIDLNAFDQAWVSQMTNAITAVWDNAQPETGWTEILFELNRGGKVIKFEVTASTQSFVLNTAAERAVKTATIAPLPRDFNENTLRVRLRFNYKGR